MNDLKMLPMTLNGRKGLSLFSNCSLLPLTPSSMSSGFILLQRTYIAFSSPLLLILRQEITAAAVALFSLQKEYLPWVMMFVLMLYCLFVKYLIK